LLFVSFIHFKKYINVIAYLSPEFELLQHNLDVHGTARIEKVFARSFAETTNSVPNEIWENTQIVLKYLFVLRFLASLTGDGSTVGSTEFRTPICTSLKKNYLV
jgi:hypothetical protein